MAVIRQDDAQKLLDQIELLRKLITGQGKTRTRCLPQLSCLSLVLSRNVVWMPKGKSRNPYGTLSRRMGGRRCISGFLS